MTTNRRLDALRVSALLVSASYGVAFLLGSGEMAMHFGMAGSLYPVVTALGMVVLAMFAVGYGTSQNSSGMSWAMHTATVRGRVLPSFP